MQNNLPFRRLLCDIPASCSVAQREQPPHSVVVVPRVSNHGFFLHFAVLSAHLSRLVRWGDSRLQMAGVLVDQNISKKMLSVLNICIFVNPCLVTVLACLLIFPDKPYTPAISGIISFMSISVAASAITSGSVFSRSLSRYFEGAFIARVAKI